ncbi:transposase [Virgibacillus sp. 179-BFC.A HS]|uniref:Transposase n=1 Tax=Tigheibacillus jepli TaxID=3035914 RepID=A0ABU5CEE8_9BACI|nr:transposase [Virgibacillus sp. 179-BFC.A HS]MDY0404656.1 transposase [Virgibacillus sp. 179-BFC.A HS]
MTFILTNQTSLINQMVSIIITDHLVWTELGPIALKEWIQWGIRCQLNPMVDVAYKLKKYYDGVVQWFQTKLTNGLLEGTNSLFQAAKRKARGYLQTRTLSP